MTYKDHVSRQLEPEEPEEPEDQNKASRKKSSTTGKNGDRKGTEEHEIGNVA